MLGTDLFLNLRVPLPRDSLSPGQTTIVGHPTLVTLAVKRLASAPDVTSLDAAHVFIWAQGSGVELGQGTGSSQLRSVNLAGPQGLVSALADLVIKSRGSFPKAPEAGSPRGLVYWTVMVAT